jgi:hypothetical protein
MDTIETKFEAKHFEAIGRMVVYFQTIEVTINKALAALIEIHWHEKSHSRFEALMSEVNFKAKISTLRSLLNDIKSYEDIKTIFNYSEARDQKNILAELEDLKSLLKDAELAANIRNKYCHSEWVAGGLCGPPGTIFRSKKTAKGKGVKLEFEFEHFDDLSEKADFIEDISKKMINQTVLLQSLFSANNAS